MLKKSLVLAILTLQLQVFGQNLEVGSISVVGSGCPAGTASASLSPDNSAVSVLFDSYTMTVGGSSQLNVSILDCKIIIPIRLPPGTSVMLDSLDYRGFASLPVNGTMMFGTRDGFHSSNASHEDPADRVTRIIGAYQDNFILQRKRPVQIWSRCGDRVELTSYSRLLIRTNGQRQETSAGIDSADGSFNVRFNIVTRPCQAPPPGIRPMPGTPGHP